jgi:hypothetical protein
MKKINNKIPRSLALATVVLATAATSQAAVLATWDVWDSGSADSTTSGFTAMIAGFDTIRSDRGIADGTFGNDLAGASSGDTRSAAYRGTSSNVMTLTLTNGTASAYSIDSLHFDFGVRTNEPNSFTANYTSGGLGPAPTLLDTQTGLAQQNSTNGNLFQFDYNLSSSLADTILAAGESAVFTVDFSFDTGSGSSLSLIDNVALQGTAVPEPSSAALLGLGGLALILRRRR